MPLPAEVEAHTQQGLRIFAALAAAVTGIWATTNLDDFDGFLGRVIPVTNAAMSAQAASAAVWLARNLGAPPAATRVDYADIRRGVTQPQVYRRPLLEVRKHLKAGADFDAALSRGGQRLQAIAHTDAQTAYFNEVFRLRHSGPPPLFRRVVSGPNACGLCVAIAGQRLRTNEVKRRHTFCKCRVVAIADAADDPGPLVADEARTDPADVTVRDHAELGEVLTYADHRFADLNQ